MGLLSTEEAIRLYDEAMKDYTPPSQDDYTLTTDVHYGQDEYEADPMPDGYEPNCRRPYKAIITYFDGRRHAVSIIEQRFLLITNDTESTLHENGEFVACSARPDHREQMLTYAQRRVDGDW